MSSDNKPVIGAGFTISKRPTATVHVQQDMSPQLVVELLWCVGTTLRFPVKKLDGLSEESRHELELYGYEVEE